MNREDFERVYLDWVNNFFSVDGYAEYYGLRRDEAEALIRLAWAVCDRPKGVMRVGNPEN